MRTLLSVPVALLVLVAIGEPAGAASRILYLRKDCTGVPDCYQDLIPAYSAIFQQRFLGSTDPYSIEVGPGEFSFSFGWSAFVGDVTIRGSGVGSTRISPTANGKFLGPSGLSIQDLSFSSGAVWQNGGSSHWANVDLGGAQFGLSVTCPSGVSGTHEIYSSTVTTRTQNATHDAAVYVSCGTVRLHGSEIRVRGNGGINAAAQTAVGVDVAGTGAVSVYGSAVRVPALQPGETFDVNVGGSGADGLVGVRVGAAVGGAAAGGGSFEMHGGIVNVTAKNASAGRDATAVRTFSNAPADLADTAFAVSSSATAYRLRGDGSQTPFLWQPSEGGPPVANLESADGADLYVETGCTASGVCDGSGTETHLMIYNKALCPTERWFDATELACRTE